MERLNVTFPNGNSTEFELHPERAKQLYLAGIITREFPGRFEINPSIGEELKLIMPVVYALLDLNGDNV